MSELPKTRAEARALKSRLYNTGRPCKHNHLANRYTAGGSCVDCIATYSKKHREKYPEKHRQWHKDWYDRNPARRHELARLHRLRQKALDPDGWREHNREQARRWRDRHREHYRAYQREYQRLWRLKNAGYYKGY